MEIVITINIDDNREVKVNVEKKEESKKAPVDRSIYARLFDAGCVGWTIDPESNLMFLKYQQTYADDLLRKQGYLFLNDVYSMLGIPKTKDGQVVGWIYDKENPIGDNFVDFCSNLSEDFINGRENVVLLDFNVDGNILNYI